MFHSGSRGSSGGIRTAQTPQKSLYVPLRMRARGWTGDFGFVPKSRPMDDPSSENPLRDPIRDPQFARVSIRNITNIDNRLHCSQVFEPLGQRCVFNCCNQCWRMYPWTGFPRKGSQNPAPGHATIKYTTASRFYSLNPCSDLSI